MIATLPLYLYPAAETKMTGSQAANVAVRRCVLSTRSCTLFNPRRRFMRIDQQHGGSAVKISKAP